jgi:hypothetical protein
MLDGQARGCHVRRRPSIRHHRRAPRCAFVYLHLARGGARSCMLHVDIIRPIDGSDQ